MALWGISTTTETADNNYAIPKYNQNVDRNRSPWNTFADVRGWIQRRYKSTENSGLSTSYYDEVLVAVAGLNTEGGSAGLGLTATGLGAATPVAVFFEDPNLASPISVGGGATTGITTGSTAYVHVVWNETVYAGAGSTVRIQTFDANGANESTVIVATAASVAPGVELPIFTNVNGYELVKNFNGQISNRISFAFTTPSTVLSANVAFKSTTVNSTVALGTTNIFVADTSGVVAGVSSVSVGTAITNTSIVSVGTTFIQIGTGSTVASVIGIGTAVTFSTVENKTKLVVDASAGVVGTITDFSGGSAVEKALTGLVYNIGGAGNSSTVGLGTDVLIVTA